MDVEERLSRTRVRPANGALALALARALRPRQWLKNGLIFVALIFAFKLDDLDLALRALAAFAIFSLLSSAGYLVNDLLDLERDRLHPRKSRRPLASGQIRPGEAVALAALLVATCVPAAFALNQRFGLVAVAYLALTLAYSFKLKHVVLVDLFAIAGGFVLRAIAGAVVIDVPISPWLYVCTVLASLFLGLAKRRNELVLLERGAGSHRRILDEYTLGLLDQLITIVSAAAIMAYSLYTFSAENLPPNHAMMATIPVVIYGIFRYLYLVYVKNQGGSPEEMLLSDRPLAAAAFGWIALSILILYVFRPPF